MSYVDLFAQYILTHRLIVRCLLILSTNIRVIPSVSVVVTRLLEFGTNLKQPAGCQRAQSGSSMDLNRFLTKCLHVVDRTHSEPKEDVTRANEPS